MDIPLRFNIGAELIERNLRAGRGDAPAIWSGGKTLSYRDFAALTDRLAGALLRAGVEPAQRVLFILPDSPELAGGSLAAMKVGAVAVPCNPLLRPADYAYFVEESRARVLITSRACIERVEPALGDGTTVKRGLAASSAGWRRRRTDASRRQPPRGTSPPSGSGPAVPRDARRRPSTRTRTGRTAASCTGAPSSTSSRATAASPPASSSTPTAWEMPSVF